MATRYLYNDKKYTSLWSLRQAIWQNEHKAYGNPITQEEWDQIGIAVTVEQYDPLDEMDLEQLRARCLSLLESQFTFYRNAKATYVQSSLGFKANANATAYMDVDGLIGQVQAMDVKALADNSEAQAQTITFMDFDNQPHNLTADQLVLLKNEIAGNGSRAYAVKWTYRTKIEQAQTNAELKELMVFNFNPQE